MDWVALRSNTFVRLQEILVDTCCYDQALGIEVSVFLLRQRRYGSEGGLFASTKPTLLEVTRMWFKQFPSCRWLFQVKLKKKIIWWVSVTNATLTVLLWERYHRSSIKHGFFLGKTGWTVSNGDIFHCFRYCAIKTQLLELQYRQYYREMQ